MAAVTICSDFGAQKNKVCHFFHCFPIYWMGPDAMILVFWMLSFKPIFSLASFTFIKRLFNSSLLSAIRVVSSALLRLFIFCLESWFQLVLHPAQHFTWGTLHICKQGDNIQPWHTPFPIWNQSVSCTVQNCCFLTRIQVSQEAGKVVWYSHLLKNFTQIIVIHTIKGFSIVNKAEIKLSCLFVCLFFYDPTDDGNLISGFLLFLNPAGTSGSSQFIYCWSLAWRILSITLLTCEMSAIVWYLNNLWHCLFWDWNENWPFPVLWPLLSFLNLPVYWVQHFHGIIF